MNKKKIREIRELLKKKLIISSIFPGLVILEAEVYHQVLALLDESECQESCLTCGGDIDSEMVCQVCRKKRQGSFKRYAHREICSLCHQVNRVGFYVPDDIWQAAVHKSQINNIICLQCFTRLADERKVVWDKEIKFYPVSRITSRSQNEPESQ